MLDAVAPPPCVWGSWRWLSVLLCVVWCGVVWCGQVGGSAPSHCLPPSPTPLPAAAAAAAQRVVVVCASVESSRPGTRRHKLSLTACCCCCWAGIHLFILCTMRRGVLRCESLC